MNNKHLKKLAKLSKEEWEALCERCGRCCFEKVDDGDAIYYTSKPCDRFDPETRLCTVYDKRNQVRPDCLPLTPEVLTAGFLPADCPYVAGLEDYTAPELEGGDDL